MYFDRSMQIVLLFAGQDNNFQVCLQNPAESSILELCFIYEHHIMMLF